MKSFQDRLKTLAIWQRENPELLFGCYGHLYSLEGQLVGKDITIRLERFRAHDFMRGFLTRLFGEFLLMLDVQGQFESYQESLLKIFNTLDVGILDEKKLLAYEENKLSKAELNHYLGRMLARSDLFLDSGYFQHTLHIYISATEHLYKINTGVGRIDASIEQYKVTKHKGLNNRTLYELLIHRNMPSNKAMIHRHLNQTLGLEFVQTIEGALQSTENCMYMSGHTGILVMLLEALPRDVAQKVFEAWQTWTQTKTLDLVWEDLGTNPLWPQFLARLCGQKINLPDYKPLMTLLLPWLIDCPATVFEEWLIVHWLNNMNVLSDKSEGLFDGLRKIGIEPAQLIQHCNHPIALACAMLVQQPAMAVGKVSPEVFDSKQDVSFQGFSWLHMAVVCDDLSLAERILKRQPDLVNQSDFLGRTPLSYVKTAMMQKLLNTYGGHFENDLEYTKQLKKWMQENREDCIDLSLDAYRAPEEMLHFLAGFYPGHKLHSYIKSHPKQLFLENYSQQSPLHKACESGALENLNHLIAAGEFPDKADMNGLTPLYVALKNKQYTVAEALIHHPCVCLETMSYRQDQTYADLLNTHPALLEKYHQQFNANQKAKQIFLHWQESRPEPAQGLFVEVLNTYDIELIRGCLQCYPTLFFDDFDVSDPYRFLYSFAEHTEIWTLIKQLPGFECIDVQEKTKVSQDYY